MKQLTIFILTFLFIGCNPREYYHYDYESKPVFTKGYAEFWGPYYQKYGVDANICSLSLFSDSLIVDSLGNLTGFGQYLYLEDIYYGLNSPFLQEGEYEISMDRDSMSITPGQQMEVDGMKFEIGAKLYFIEKDSKYSIMKKIEGGTMTVSYLDSLTQINFVFEMEDQTMVEGSFKAVLPYYDYSSINAGGGLSVRANQRPITPLKVNNLRNQY